jgi:hypothetical protein
LTSANPLTLPPIELRTIRVLQTIKEGRRIFSDVMEPGP